MFALSCCIWIYGDILLHIHCMVFNSFSLLSMTSLDIHGHFLMHNKSETMTHIHDFVAYCHTQFSMKIKTIWSDNGSDFIIPSYYASLGILHQRGCIETPQYDSTIKRNHRHLLNVTRSLLYHAKLPKCFWSFSLCHATYLINRLCNPTINNITPYELLFKEPSSFTHLKTFGCLTYATTITRHRDKLNPQATKCIFLGYPNGIKVFLFFI